MPLTQGSFHEQSAQLNNLLNTDPAEAIRSARQINLDAPEPECFNLMILRASALVDGGALTQQQEAIEEGIDLFRKVHSRFPTASVTYNLGNGLAAAIGTPPHGLDWLDHQERTRKLRAEARQCFWKVTQATDNDSALRTQAWTNLANQFSNCFRLGEAHDAWLAALKADPENGVAASSAARNLLWLYEQGGCSELTRTEAVMLAKIAHRNLDRVNQYAGVQAAEKIAAFANTLGPVHSI